MKLGLTPFTRRITQRTVMWGLSAGFALVLVLLGIAGLVAVRDSHAIRRSAGGLVQEQLLIARLLNEVQVEENTLTEVLHRLTRTPQTLDRSALLRELVEADQSVARLAVDAATTPKARVWRQLEQSVRSFSKEARSALDQDDPISEESITSLFSRHDEVVELIHDLLRDSSEHLRTSDEQIERQSRDLADESALLLGSSLILAGLCAIGTILFVRHSIRRIEWQTDEINRVSWHMLQTQEETARRFSHELHDELGQSLAAVRANLTSKSQDDQPERRADCVQLVDEAIANVRELSQLLRPVILDDFGLDAGLRWLTEKFGQRMRIKLEYESYLAGRLQSETETHLFRIAQEALTNIARHAQATQVVVHLEAVASIVRLSISDNGHGLPPDRQESPASLGLIGMKARARECGGILDLQPVQPQGLRIVVEVPLRLMEPES
jgi:signal transduction histidine kinase